MKLKKSLALLLAVFLVLGLCACGDADEALQTDAESTPASIGEILFLMPSDATTEASDDGADGADAAAEFSGPVQAGIKKTLLLDAENVKITATGMDYDGAFGPEVALTIENGTGRPLAVQCDDVYINGCKVMSGLYTEVAAGETVDDVMSIYSVDLAAYGIDTIAEITVYFLIKTTDDWETYYLSDAAVLRTGVPEGYGFAYDDSGEVLYQTKGFKIVSKGRADEDTYWGPAVLVYFENSTKKTVTFQSRDASVGGSPVDAILSTTLRPGTCAIDDLSLDKVELAESGVNELGTLALNFVIYDNETGEEILVTDVVTLGF